MFRFVRSFGGVALLLALMVTSPAQAGIKVYEDGDKYIEIGGRVQFQYLSEDPDDGDTEDTFFFRRLRPYIAGSVTENWDAKIQFDFGKADGSNEVAVKDAYMRYKGWKNMQFYIGNTKSPFSREFNTSSKRQQLVERSFPGDHNYGVPDRQLGFKLDGQNESKKVTYGFAIGSESHDPSASKMDFDTPANQSSDWNEGVVVAGRIDFHPMGYAKPDQGDFHSDSMKFTLSLGAFSWSNDDDNNTYTSAGTSTSSSKADLDSSDGIEVSAGLRGRGLSLDLAYQMVSGDTVDGAFTGGIYINGSSDLDKLALEGGYVFDGNKFELVGGWETLDTDAYTDEWTRTSVGFNYFWNKHKSKVQFTYRMNENENGVPGADANQTFVQFQQVF